jgi:hypothetical protein
VHAPAFKPGFFPWCGQFTHWRSNTHVHMDALGLYWSKVLHLTCANTRPVSRQRLVSKSIGCAGYGGEGIVEKQANEQDTNPHAPRRQALTAIGAAKWAHCLYS